MNHLHILVALAACVLHSALAATSDDSMACKGMCPRSFVPVCGMDNSGNMKTFANKCLFEYEECNNRGAGWRIVKQTECDADSKTAPAAPCMGRCSREYVPVCGMDNTGTMRTFANKCVFEFEQCSNRDDGWKLIKDQACEAKVEQSMACSGMCPKNYMPVCGTDNSGNTKTFANKCLFEFEECNNRGAGWRITANHACDAAPVCNEICTREWAPICAVNNFGKMTTFGNNCGFESEKCKNRADGWRMVKHGACEEVSAAKSTTGCLKPCTYEYVPVCGMNNYGKQQTFGNKCSFEIEQCSSRGEGWKLVKESACEEVSAVESSSCKKFCTYEYKPVCGMNNYGTMQTFGNKCAFEVQECNNRADGWKLVKSEACEVQQVSVEEPKACRNFCTFEFAPVCGVNNFGKQQTFPNKCAFEVEQCHNRAAGWRMIATKSC